MECNNLGLNRTGKTILCGHYHASWGHHYLHNNGPEWDDYFAYEAGYRAHFETFKDKGIKCLDACTAVSGLCNCEVLTIGKEQLKPYV